MFNDLRVVIYLTRNAIELWNVQGKVSVFEISSQLVSNTEIINQKEFEKVVSEWILTQSITHSRALLICGNDLVFDTEIPSTEENTEEKIRTFLSTIPYESSLVAHSVESTKTATYVYAVNQSLVQTVMHIFQNNKIAIDAVYPLKAFRTLDQTDTQLSTDTVLWIIQHRKLAQESAFFQKKLKEKKGRNTVLIVSIAVSLVGVVLLAGIFFYQQFWHKSPTAPLGKPTVVKIYPSVTPSPPISKEKVSIQVLNGSGVQGEALRIKNLMIDAGFNEVTTGNAEKVRVGTLVEYSTQSAFFAQQEVKELLLKNYETVDFVEQEASGSSDIVITTGTK